MQISSLETLFQELLYQRDQTSDLATLGPWLQRQIATCHLPDLHKLAFSAHTYTRTPIAQEDTRQNFEAWIIRWDQDAETPVHGHPAFSFYYVISGMFQMDCFSQSATNGLQCQNSQLMCSADSTWFLGKAGKYDNFIHRVKCLEPGHTFHVYSEDAQQGVLFPTAPEVHFNEAYCV